MLRQTIHNIAAAALLATALGRWAAAAELDPIKVALLVDGMATRGSGFDGGELHSLGVDGLAAVLDHLLPDTAPPPAPLPAGPPAEEIRRLIARLDADEPRAREIATEALIAQARGRKTLVEAALQNNSTEVRFRAARVLASWESPPAARLGAYLSGFWAYLEGIGDAPRLELLARRTLKAFDQGMPEGDRLHLMRLCIAGVAHGRDDASCDLLRPLVRHSDVRIATLAAETVGAYKTETRFVPQMLVDALASDHKPVVEAALRFVIGGQDERRREPVRLALRRVFDGQDEPLKFQACLPLLRDFQDGEAWVYVLEQTQSEDGNRVRTALNWIGDTKNCGRPPDTQLMQRLEAMLAGGGQRRAAVQVLGAFAGEEVVRRLIALLGDGELNVASQADASLLAQPDRELVKRLLNKTAASEPSGFANSRARALLAKIDQP